MKYNNGGTWETIGTTNLEGEVFREVFPNLSQTFQMTYGGATQQQSVTPATNSELVFQA